MARVARAEVFDPAEVSVFHCVNRCVRRCFLCGEDPLTGRNYSHRKAWLEARLELLAGAFGIDVLAFAILSNHIHLVLRNRPDVVATWSDTEVTRRWLRLCPKRRSEHDAEPPGEPPEPPETLESTEAELDSIRCVPEKLVEIRRRLSDISWLMRMIAEPVARQANREDGVNGRFWQGRFHAVRLCDEAALLACMAYVDLNLVRAGIAATPKTSEYTSIKRRIESLDAPPAQVVTPGCAAQAAPPDGWLAPIPLDEATTDPGPLASATGRRASDKGCLPLSLADDLELVDWTGRQMVVGKSSIPAHLPPILERLGIAAGNWLPLVTGFGRLFHRVAGAPRTLARWPRWQRFRPGQAALLGTP